jgi:hypothetical protein
MPEAAMDNAFVCGADQDESSYACAVPILKAWFFNALGFFAPLIAGPIAASRQDLPGRLYLPHPQGET